MNGLLYLLLTTASIEILTSGLLLYKYIKLRTVALFLLSLSFISFSILSIVGIFVIFRAQPIFPVVRLYLGVIGVFIFIIYCSYVETESLTSSKVFFGVSLVSVIVTIITLDIPKFQKITLPTGEIVWVSQDSTLYTLLLIFLIYTSFVFFTTFIPFLNKALRTRHAYFLVGNLFGGVLSIFGAGFGIFYIFIMPTNNGIMITDKLFISHILITLYPVSVLITALFDVEMLWAPSFSLDALYVFHSSGITVFSFNFSEKKNTNDVLITSILSALIVAIKEVIGKTSFINRISLEDRLVYLKRVEDLYFALFCTQPNKSLHNAFLRFVDEFTRTCAGDIIVKNKQTLFVRNASRGYEVIKKIFPVF